MQCIINRCNQNPMSIWTQQRQLTTIRGQCKNIEIKILILKLSKIRHSGHIKSQNPYRHNVDSDVASIDNNSGSMKQKLNTIEIPNIEILHISNLTIDTWILYSFVSCKLPCLMHEMPPLLELLPFILIWKLHFLLFSKSNFKH